MALGQRPGSPPVLAAETHRAPRLFSLSPGPHLRTSPRRWWGPWPGTLPIITLNTSCHSDAFSGFSSPLDRGLREAPGLSPGVEARGGERRRRGEPPALSALAPGQGRGCSLDRAVHGVDFFTSQRRSRGGDEPGTSRFTWLQGMVATVRWHLTAALATFYPEERSGFGSFIHGRIFIEHLPCARHQRHGRDACDKSPLRLMGFTGLGTAAGWAGVCSRSPGLQRLHQGPRLSLVQTAGCGTMEPGRGSHTGRTVNTEPPGGSCR